MRICVPIHIYFTVLPSSNSLSFNISKTWYFFSSSIETFSLFYLACKKNFPPSLNGNENLSVQVKSRFHSYTYSNRVRLYKLYIYICTYNTRRYHTNNFILYYICFKYLPKVASCFFYQYTHYTFKVE